MRRSSRLVRRTGAAAAAGVLWAAGACAPALAAPDSRAASPVARAAQAGLELSADEKRIIELVDAYRRSLGLSGLSVYPTLLEEARWYAADMAFNDSFSVTHIDSLGRTIDQRFWDFGYPITRPLGQSTSSGKLTPEETFEQMRTSRLHDEIMRDPRFRLVGAGIGWNDRTDSRGFWVLSFARDDPADVKAKAARAARARAAAKKARKARAAKNQQRRARRQPR